MKLHKLALFATVASLAFPAMAQETSAPEDADTASSEAAIIVTGSRIKRDPNNSPLPLTIITPDDITREGINSPEQLISFLTANGNGADNLASNSDVVSGAARGGNNGLSAANLRGQGAGSTLVLLNGRRVASHGIGGGAVDVNQIPFAAIERIEVLEDGASAIYGTDAIGGVINFITKSSFQGIALNGFVDITQEGDSPIYRLSGTAGYGDLDEQGFNIMGAVSKSWNGVLYGRDRDFVNGNQPNRGLSVDTRGTPIATMFAQGANALFAPAGSLLTGISLIEAGATTAASGGINILDLPGGAGCDSMDGGMAYDEVLWSIPGARYACAWDTGRAATLQQPLETLTYYGKATVALGDHKISAEVTGSNADSAKRFSNNQYTGNTGTLPLYYPLNATTAATYNDIYNRLLAVFPGVAANYGRPIAYRFRCIACGPREYETNSKTFRAGLNIEGPLGGTWDYRAGGSYAKSETSSVLGSGYHYRGIRTFNDPTTAINEIGTIDPLAPIAPGATAPGIVGLLNSGILNPFSLVQSDAALAALDAISAEGVTLYGGQYEVKQFDASISGSLFDLPGGAVQVAIGADYRRETYSFNGSAAAVAGQPDIFNVAFDNVNALTPKNRTVKALYGEVLIPVFEPLEFTAAVRLDDYSGFGTTINPKFSAKFRPFDWLMFRGSYNTGFRVPDLQPDIQRRHCDYGQLRAARRLIRSTCPVGWLSINTPPIDPNCAQINAWTRSPAATSTLGPKTAEQFSLGVVLQARAALQLALGRLLVDRLSTDTITTFDSPSGSCFDNALQTFPDRWSVKDAAGDHHSCSICAADQYRCTPDARALSSGNLERRL
jgi:iron complex outermembrane receptor protein